MAESLPILIDGSHGAGGGQLLRTALALSCVTGRPFGLTRIRSGRERPGLRPHHLEAVRAAARLCEAEVSGDVEGGQRLSFAPSRRAPAGDWRFELDGSSPAPSLFQLLCWPLALAGGPSTLTITGATHPDRGPSFHELALVWAPAMARLGFHFELGLQAAGFGAGGSGLLTARIEPARSMPPLDLPHRGMLREVEVLAMVGGLPYVDAVAEAAAAVKELAVLGVAAEAERLILPVRGSRGRHVLVVASFERIRSGHAATRSGEQAAQGAAAGAVASFRDHLAKGGAVDPALAEQLLLPAALLAAGLVRPPAGVIPATRYTTGANPSHLEGTAAVIERFLDVEVSVIGHAGEEAELRVQPPGSRLGLLPLRG